MLVAVGLKTMYCSYPMTSNNNCNDFVKSMEVRRKTIITVSLVNKRYNQLHLPTIVLIISLTFDVFDVFLVFSSENDPSNNPK